MGLAGKQTPFRFECTTSHRHALAGRARPTQAVPAGPDRYSPAISDNSHYRNIREAVQSAHIHAARRTHNHHILLGNVGPRARVLHAAAIAHLRGKGIQPIDAVTFERLASTVSSRPARLCNQLLRVGLCRKAGGSVVLADADLYDLPDVEAVAARRDAWRAAKARLRAGGLAGELTSVAIIAEDCVVKSRKYENVLQQPPAAPPPPQPAARPPEVSAWVEEHIVNIAARHVPREAVHAELAKGPAELLAAKIDHTNDVRKMAAQRAALYAAGTADYVPPCDAMAYADSRAVGLPRMAAALERQWSQQRPTRVELHAALATCPRNWGQVLHSVQTLRRRSTDRQGNRDGPTNATHRTAGAGASGRMVG